MMTKGQTFTVSDEDLEVELELQPTMDGIVEVKDETYISAVPPEAFSDPSKPVYPGAFPDTFVCFP